MQDADAVVIGAGHNGLAAALALSKAGWKVAVIEQAATPGGASKSAELTRDGFIHDTYATNIGMFLGSEFYTEHGKDMEEYGFEPVFSSHPYASVFPDGDGIRVFQNEQETDAEFRGISERDAAAWQELKEYFDATAPYFTPLMGMELPSWKAFRQLAKMYRRLKYRGTAELASTIMQSPREFVEAWFEDARMQALVAPWAMHLDFGPDISNGAVFPFIESIENHRNGMGFVKGGISHLPDSMVAAIEANGGEVKTGQSVDEVIVKKGRAVGVRLDTGRKITAKRAVIGNVTPTQLVTKLLDARDLPSKFVQKARNYRYGPGTMMIHLALDGPLEWEAGEDVASFAYVHIGPYVQDMATTYTDAVNGTLPESPLLVVSQPTAADPSRAPAGKHTLWIQVRALPGVIRGDAASEIAPASWDNVKERYAERVIDKLAEYAPNVREVMLERAVLSPADLERDNPNLVGGDNIAGSHHLAQHYLFRPIPGYSRYATPLKNLYMCGASTWPGGGLNATSGHLLAKKLTKWNVK